MKKFISVIAILLLSSISNAAYVAVPKVQPPPPPPVSSNPMIAADGWVICGDTSGQYVTGDGCKEYVGREQDCFFTCGSRYEVTSYRDFLQKRKPEAEYLGVQVIYIPNGIRALVFYRLRSPGRK